MPKDYDIEEAFRAIENELIDSMMRNLSNHRAEETKEGYNWTSWQAEQLKALNKYKQENQKKFTKRFSDINRKITESIIKHRKAGATDQEIDILKAIKKGAKLTHKAGSTIEGAFFRVNDRKLDALLSEINGSMHRAETAMLRMANDQYRKSIFNAQVYFNTGAGTYEKAVDMATKDFLSRGINCVQYKNGARVNIASYAGMALRTANTRAYLQGEGEKRKEWGISTVVVHKRGLPCSKCAKWIGKILIDDVWSGGKASDGPYPLMSQAIAGGLYHPNCKDGHSTYYPGISDKPEKVTKKEMQQAVIAERQESRNNLIQRNIDRFDRLSGFSLDEENQKQYRRKCDKWKSTLVNFKTGDFIDINEYVKKQEFINKFEKDENYLQKMLNKESEEWIKQLTEEEIKSIEKYTYNSGDKKPNRFFERLNTMLRGESPRQENLIRNANNISKAIEKNELKHNIICYRNLDVNLYENLREGDIFKEKQFISTSVVRSQALNKPFKVIIYVKKGARGAYIEKLSKFPAQREFLLDKNNLFRVLSKKENLVELEVI